MSNTTMLGQQTLQALSTSISYFWLSTKNYQGSSRNSSPGRSSVAQMIKNTRAPLKLSNSKRSSSNKKYKSANKSSKHASQYMNPLKIYLQDNICYSPISQAIKKVIITNASSIKKQLACLAKIIE